MKVKLLKQGTYATFDSHHQTGAELLLPDDVRDWPDWYAKSLITSGMAKEVANLPPDEIVVTAEVKPPAPVRQGRPRKKAK